MFFLILLGLSIIVVYYSGLLSIDLNILSFNDALDLAKTTLSSWLLFLMVAKIISLVINSNNLDEFYINLLRLLLALSVLAFFSMILSFIFSMFTGILVGSSLVYFDNFDVLKMENNSQDGQQAETGIKQDDVRGGEDNKKEEDQKPNPNSNPQYPDNSGNNCPVCTIIDKVEARWEDSDLDPKTNQLNKTGKAHDFTQEEGDIVREARNDAIGDEESAINKHQYLDRSELTPSGINAKEGDLLVKSNRSPEGRYEACTNKRKILIKLMELYRCMMINFIITIIIIIIINF